MRCVAASASRAFALGALFLSCDSGRIEIDAPDARMDGPVAPAEDIPVPDPDLPSAPDLPEAGDAKPEEKPDDEAAAAATGDAADAEPIKKKKKKKGGYKGGSKSKGGKIDLHYDKDPFGPDEPSPNQVQMQQEAIQYELDDISNDLDEALEKIEELEGKK